MKKTKLDIFPSYAKVLKAKQDCYPKLETITNTDSSAEVTLQCLLDHTAKRIVESQQHVLKMPEDDLSNLTVIGASMEAVDNRSTNSEFRVNLVIVICSSLLMFLFNFFHK